MKRIQGIWLVIAAILIIGIISTGLTRDFVSRQETVALESKLETGAVADLSPNARTGEPEPAVGFSAELSAGDIPEQTDAAVAAAGVETSAETAADTETTLAIPPVGQVMAAEAGESESGQDRYTIRLQELDEQIAKNRADKKDSTTNTLKVNAEYELRLWETEMETLLDGLSVSLGAAGYEELLVEQRAWLRERESDAMAAAKKYSGSALESVEYTSSLAELTRSRVYAIVAEYHDELAAD